MASTIESSTITDLRINWLDTILSIFDDGAPLDDSTLRSGEEDWESLGDRRDRNAKMESRQREDPVSRYRAEKARESLTSSRKMKIREHEKQNLKNRVSKYLNTPTPVRKNIQKQKCAVSKGSQGAFESANKNQESKPIEVTEIEIPDDASEVTLPTPLQSNFLGWPTFSTQKSYDEITQPELETRRLAKSLLTKENANRGHSRKSLESYSNSFDSSSSDDSTVIEWGLFGNSAPRRKPKQDAREMPQCLYRERLDGFEERDLSDEQHSRKVVDGVKALKPLKLQDTRSYRGAPESQREALKQQQISLSGKSEAVPNEEKQQVRLSLSKAERNLRTIQTDARTAVDINTRGVTTKVSKRVDEDPPIESLLPNSHNAKRMATHLSNQSSLHSYKGSSLSKVNKSTVAAASHKIAALPPGSLSL